MKFVQKKDGSADIIFEEHEIKIIQEKKSLHFPSITFKHFSNVLSKFIMDWNLNFNDEVKNMYTKENTVIKGEQQSLKR